MILFLFQTSVDSLSSHKSSRPLPQFIIPAENREEAKHKYAELLQALLLAQYTKTRITLGEVREYKHV